MSAADEDVHRRLLRARDLMDRRYADPLDTRRLAAVALMGTSHFIREFRRVFGETPHRYLQRRRVERAMQLLRDTDASVTDICLTVGFTSLGTFSRRFSEVTGTSPTRYRAATSTLGLRAPTSFTMRWTRPAGAAGPEARDFGEATPPGPA